ncbi:exopolysaccharide production repressor protein [Mesorhizobium sp. M1300]|uniref:exopolysaccharide production repressor protein n=1 Tax=Mesorhizobium sp. M1300 TaxID=2957077 RepID=UPI003338E6AD
MPLKMFCRVLGLVLCSNALIVYFASHSIRLAVVMTLGCSLLLQLAYFGSVLFLIWWSGCASRAGQMAEHFGSCKEVGAQLPDHDEVTNESTDLRQLDQMLAMSLLLP